MAEDETVISRLSAYLERQGYILVAEECPECGHGQLVKHGKDGRVVCTAYGQCELAPG